MGLNQNVGKLHNPTHDAMNTSNKIMICCKTPVVHVAAVPVSPGSESKKLS